MNISQSEIEALARLLDSQEARPLGADERATLRAALLELVSAQSLIAVQASMLSSFDADARRIESLAGGALDRARLLVSGPRASGTFDFDTSAAARRELLDRIEKAESGGAILEAALRFVAAGLALAG